MVRGTTCKILGLLSCIVMMGYVVSFEQSETPNVIVPIIFIGNSSRPPQITYISPNQAKINQCLTDFICTVENIAGYDVLWKRSKGNSDSEAELISTNTSLNISDDRFSVSFNASTSSFNLHLDDIRPNDEGTYICEIPINSTHSISQKTTLLNLNVMPHFAHNSSSSKITVNVSADVKIECYVDGSPMPDVYIMRHNGAPLRNNQTFLQGNVLEIKNITKREEGWYLCSANNTASSVFGLFILVNVQAPPIIHSCSLKFNYYPEANVALECSIESHVTPDIVWFENDRRYGSSETGPNFESMVTSTGKFFTASLKIIPDKPSELGNYSIHAQNSLGKQVATILVGSKINTIS